MVRTYAIWKRDKRVGIGLASLFILCQIPMAIIMENFIQATHREYYVDSMFYVCACEC